MVVVSARHQQVLGSNPDKHAPFCPFLLSPQGNPRSSSSATKKKEEEEEEKENEREIVSGVSLGDFGGGEL